MTERCSSAENHLVPAVNFFPMARARGAPERVLHIALRDAREKQPGLKRALVSLSDNCYVDVDWTKWEAIGHAQLRTTILACAEVVKPTLVFMQIQRQSPITPEVVTQLRGVCDPSVVIVNWDGDQHFEPHQPQRDWFRELGRVCDTSLVVNTQHPAEYARMGVQNPGYLQIGIDQEIYRPTPPVMGPAIAMLASRYGGYAPYKRRQEIADKLEETYGGRTFGVYGSGWTGPSRRPLLSQDQEAPVYARADVAISMSIRNDLPRYTSDRLFRALASGAMVAVERFPDMAGLGLIDGVNCRIWSSWGELVTIIEDAMHRRVDNEPIRTAATQLAHTHHTWDARMPELLWIVDQVRAARQARSAA